MSALPPITDFTAGSVSESSFKTALSGLRDYLTGMFGATGSQGPALSAIGSPFNTVVAKTATYTVVATDRGVHLDCSGTFTLGFTAAATLGSGFCISLRNSGAGAITVDPNGSETLDGSTSVILAPGQSLVMLCDGSSFRSVGKTAPAGALLNVQVFTSSGTYTPTAGVTRILVDVLGPGGVGSTGSTNTASNIRSVGGRGGDGGCLRSLFTTTVVSQTVTVGASGGLSSFGSLIASVGQGISGTGGFVKAAGPSGSNGLSQTSATATSAPISSTGGVGGGGGGGLPNSGAGQANSGGGGAGGIGGISFGKSIFPAGTGGAGGSGLVVIYEYA